MPFLAAAIPAALGASAATTGAISAGVTGILGAASNAVGNQQNFGQRTQAGALADYQNLVAQGPGAEAVQASSQAQNDLAAELQRLQQQGLNPTEQDINQQNQFASQLFQSRRVQQEQDFLRQGQQFAQDAARMGRSPLDPVFRNKLAEQQLMAQERLGAEQNVLGTQLAMQQPMQRLNLQTQRANVLQGLASQALANRQRLAGLGNEASQVQDQGFGGGLLGALEGFSLGARKGLSAAPQVRRLFVPTSGGVRG